MEVKKVEGNDTLALLVLFNKYNKSIGLNYTEFISSSILLTELKLGNNLCLGLYVDEKLVGFSLGNKEPTRLFNILAIYVEPKYRLYAARACKIGEGYFKDFGCTGWVSDSMSSKGLRFMEKLGASPIQIKYYKEL